MSDAFRLLKKGYVPDPFQATFVDACTKEEAEKIFRKDHPADQAQIDEVQVNKFCALVIWHDPKLPTT